MTGAIAGRLGLSGRHRSPAPRWERVVAGPLAGRELLLAREANGVWTDMIDGRFDAELYSALAVLTLRTPVIWDVGGHIGYHALGFAAHQSAARVVSFEPNPANRARLRANLDRNADLAARIDVLPMALADRSGELTLVASDDVDGGGGPDTLRFDGSPGSEIMSLSAVGQRAVFLRQPGNVVMNLDRVESLDLRALGGVDDITVNDVTGTSMRFANVDLSAAGNGGAGDLLADPVTVNGTNGGDVVDVVGQGTQVDVSGLQPETRITGTDPALDHLQVNTLDGNDQVTVDQSALALIGETTDLGPGQI